MKGRYRAGIVGVMLGLLAYFPAAAQSGDTSTVVVDTSSVAANSSSTATDSAEPVVLRMIDDSIVRGWRGEKAYEYANDSAYWRWYAVQVQSG
ncbi:MAG TPA: hypothetical protein VNV35_07535, partial [Puia sp.]|nr:hypothetical protein [Puia sp.]